MGTYIHILPILFHSYHILRTSPSYIYMYTGRAAAAPHRPAPPQTGEGGRGQGHPAQGGDHHRRGAYHYAEAVLSVYT